MDNRVQSVGEKRQNLLNMAHGEYIMYLDDDDKVPEDFLETVLPELTGVDAVTFNHKAMINGKRYIISDSIYHPDEQLHDGIVKRKPLCHSIWRREVAKRSKFKDISYGEDMRWATQLNPENETKIDKVLHTYVYDDNATATAEIDRQMENACIISYSSHGRENYNRHLMNLIETRNEVLPDVDMICYSPDHHLSEYKGVKIEKYPEDYPSHSEFPYVFKPAMFQEAFSKGYDTVIWCDSTVKIKRFPTLAYDYAKTNGISAWENVGHPLNNYINDTAIKALGIPYQRLEIPQIMACVIVMHRTDHTMDILEDWFNMMDLFKEDDTDREGFKAHRHDQAILSWLLFKWGVKLLPYGTLCYPPHDTSGEYEVHFVNRQ